MESFGKALALFLAIQISTRMIVTANHWLNTQSLKPRTKDCQVNWRIISSALKVFDVKNGLQALWCLLSGEISRGAWVGQKILVKFVKLRKSRFASFSLSPCLMRSGRFLSILKIMRSYYKNVAKKGVVPEKMNILHSAFYTTGIY